MSRVSTPSYGTHLIDGITVGNFKNQQYMGTPDSFGYKGYLGLRCLPVYPFFLTTVANDFTGIANPQTLNTAYATLKSPTVTLDVPRAITASGAAGTVAVPIIVWGTDMYGNQITNQFQGPAGATLTNSSKTFKTVTAIYVNGNSVDNLSFGWDQIIGMPIVVQGFAQIVAAYWDNQPIPYTDFTGAAVDQSLITSGDARGSIGGLSGVGGEQLVVYIAPMMVGTAAAYQTDEQYLGTTPYSQPLI